MRPSPVPVELVVGGRQLSEPRLGPDGRRLAYLVDDEGASRLAVVDLEVPAGGPATRVVDLDPAPAPGRGLGGGAFDWLPDGRSVVYVDGAGGLWRAGVDVGGPAPSRVWGSAAEGGPAAQAPAVSPDGTRVAFMVDQRHIVVAALDGAAEPVVLTADRGPEFAFDPAFGPGGDVVAFQGWSPPAMAWDDAARWTAAADGSTPPERRPAGADLAIQQPGFAPDGTEIEVRDATGWANVWWGGRPLVGEGGEPFEHAGPTWGPRQRTWGASPDGRRVAFCRNEAGFGRLCVADVATGAVTELARGVHGQLSWRGDRLAALRSGARTPTEVVVYELAGDAPSRRRVAVGADPAWSSVELVEPEVLAIGSAPARHARRYRATAPGRGLLVWVHGGPTSQWDVTFLPGVPFWGSRGWDVLLVDPRGSTGHGRVYQQALRGRWGELDVDDTAALIRHAHHRGWADPGRTVVMGGSSGGLTVLAMLARHPGLVAAGVALYPVSDIADLGERSHRFERHYNQTLIGPDDTAEDRALYTERSPLHYAARIGGPLLVLHGTVDPVIPVDQSIELAARIRQAGGQVELHLLEGEGHGFRRVASKRIEYRLIESFLDRAVPPAGDR